LWFAELSGFAVTRCGLRPDGGGYAPAWSETEESMTKRNKAAMEQEIGRHRTDEESRRGLGLFAIIAVLTILGIAIWFVVNNGETS
jgi:hypothetical protein